MSFEMTAADVRRLGFTLDESVDDDTIFDVEWVQDRFIITERDRIDKIKISGVIVT